MMNMEGSYQLGDASHFRFYAHPSIASPPLYLHVPSNIIAEQTVLPISQDHFQILQWRYETQHPIFRVLCSQHQLKPNPNSIKLYTETILYTLSQLKALALPQIIYILRMTAMALDKLINRFGLFQIREGMVGITHAYKCKIWINQCRWKLKVHKKQECQSKMTQQLMKILLKKTQYSYVSAFFFQGIKKATSFFEILEFIDTFVYQNQILVPNKFTHIYKVIHPTIHHTQSPKKTHQTVSEPNMNSVLSISYDKNSQIFSWEELKKPNAISSKRLRRCLTLGIPQFKASRKSPQTEPLSPLRFKKHHRIKSRNPKRQKNFRPSENVNKETMKKFVKTKVKPSYHLETAMSSKTIEIKDQFSEQQIEYQPQKLSQMGRQISRSRLTFSNTSQNS